MEIKKENFKHYIEEMSHYDPDNMEMAARAVSELVISGQLNLDKDPEKANIIKQAFIKQMESENINVHAHAIKSVAEMISKLPNIQVLSIFEKTIKSITDIDLDDKKRDIYREFASTVLHKANQEFGPMLSHLFVDSITALLNTKNNKIDIQIILIKVISEFIRRWPNVASEAHVNFNRINLITYLLKNMQNSSNYKLVIQCQSALGQLATILNKDQLQFIFHDQKLGLFLFINSFIGKFAMQPLKNLREAVVSLQYVLKTQNPQLRYLALQISNIIIRIINVHKGNSQMDQIDINSQIIESAITCQTILLKSFPRQLQIVMKQHNNPLNNFVKQLINYDVEEGMKYVENEEMTIAVEYGDDEDCQYYEDDYKQIQEKWSWRVRAAIIKYITILMKKDHKFRSDVIKSQQFLSILGSKLTEEDSMVNLATIEAINSLVDAITIEKNKSLDQDVEDLSLVRVKSSEVDFAKMILSELSKRIQIIFKSSKFSQEIKHSVLNLVLRIVNVFKKDLQNHPKLTLQLLNQIQTQVSTTKLEGNQTQVNISKAQGKLTTQLHILRQLIFSTIGFNEYLNTLSIFLKTLLSKNHKIAAISFKGIRKMLTQFPSQMIKHGQFTKILEIIDNKLRQHDADRLVKNSVISCIGCLFENYFQNLNQFTQIRILEALCLKLQIEIQKGNILYQLTKLNSSLKVKPNQVQIFTKILVRTIESLGSMNFDLNVQAIQSTKRLIQILQNKIDKKVVAQILIKSKPLFADLKIPSYIKLLLSLFPNQFKNYVEPLIKTADTDLIIKLIELKITDANSSFNILKATAKPEKAKKISIIIGSLGITDKELIKQIDNSLWGQICLGALGYIGTPDNVDFLLQIIKDGKNQDLKFQACSALGNIGSRNCSKIIPFVINLAQNNPDCYVYIYTLRQLLIYSKNSFKQISQLTNWLLKKCQQNSEGQSQSVYYVISQCLGRIFMLSNEVLLDVLNKIQKMSKGERSMLSNSLRFSLQQKENSLVSEEYQRFIKEIMNLTSDSQVQVRHGAIKSLVSIAPSYSQIIKHYADEYFWQSLQKNLKIHDELIIEVDYGISKEKKDTGKPVRLQSFNFLKIALSKLPIDGHLHELMQTCLHKITNQTSTDLIIKRINIIKHLCQKDFTCFVSLQNQFIQKLGIEAGLLKGLQVQKQGGDERVQAYLRSLFKEILQISVISIKQSSDIIRGFVAKLKSVPRFNTLIESVEKQ